MRQIYLRAEELGDNIDLNYRSNEVAEVSLEPREFAEQYMNQVGADTVTWLGSPCYHMVPNRVVYIFAWGIMEYSRCMPCWQHPQPHQPGKRSAGRSPLLQFVTGAQQALKAPHSHREGLDGQLALHRRAGWGHRSWC